VENAGRELPATWPFIATATTSYLSKGYLFPKAEHMKIMAINTY
jgi:hypothetical protein